MTRRASIVVVSLVIAGLVAVALMIDPVVADPQEADARARSPGRSRDHEGSRSAQGPEADEGRPRPLGHDHARPRRPPRRVRAGDPHAGQRPDHDPAARASRIPRRPRRSSARPRSSSSSTSRRASWRRRSTSTGTRSRAASVYDLLAGQQAIVKDKSDQWWVFDKKKKLVVGPVSTKEKALAQVRRQAARRLQALRHPERHRGDLVRRRRRQSARVHGGVTPTGEPVLPLQVRPAGRAADDGRRPEALRHPPGLRHDDRTSRSCRSQFTNKGSDRFQEITRAETCAASSANAPQHFAIVLDREIRSWPQIDYTDGALAGGISGNAQITGIGDIQEAKDLALVLQTGALPVEFVTLDQTAISATLGKDSLNQAKTAAIVGLLARRALPAHLLPLPRPHRRARARHLRRLPLRRDPRSSTSP